jgi:hypothetical protein
LEVFLAGSRNRLFNGLALELEKENFLFVNVLSDRLCGLVVRVPGYRSRGRGSIPGAARFSEK